MADPSRHYRTRAVGCMLSDEEYRQLRDICAALRLTMRDIVLIGMRRARRILAEERRRQ
jgi:hypothetical protein